MQKFRPFIVLALVLVFLILLVVFGGPRGNKGSDSAQSAPPASSETQAGEPTASRTPADSPRIPRVSTKLVKRWMLGLNLRRPGMDARKGVALGPGALDVRPSPTSLSWYEMADIDSNGTEEKVGFMWDSDEKVIYAYTNDPIRLDDGTMARKGVVMAQFGKQNKAKRPEGSGFWAYATTRDTLSYRRVSGSLYGCRFDSTGRMTQCGPGLWARDNNIFAISSNVK